MITYSLDTNLVIPLINVVDHNRHIVLGVIKKEKNKCVICSSVIEEVKKVLRDKTALAIKKSLKILFPLKDIKEPFKRDQFLIKSFQDLMDKDKNLKNFYGLLYNKITDFLKENSIDVLPKFLSELSSEMVKIVSPSIKEHIEFDYISFNYSDTLLVKRYGDINKSISSIKFKDDHDAYIFKELAILANLELIINFYTHDKEFSKTASCAISILEKTLHYSPSTLYFSYV